MKDESYECKKCGAQYNPEEAEMINFECCDEEVTNLEFEDNNDLSFDGEESL